MSTTTQCPACGTLFKVAVEQLKDTKGWVRCGQCQEVFDAQSHIPGLAASQKPSHGLNISFNDAPVGTTSVYTAAAPDLKKDLSSSDWVNSVNPPAPTDKFPAQEVTSATQELEGQAPSFVRQAQRAQRWRSPWVRTSLAVLALLLCTTLGLQVAQHERDRIAATLPATLPWLQSLCQITGCTVEPFKHIDAVVVEASSFNKLRNEGSSELYKLGLSLKNNGNLNVAMPHIELSLNDAQDRPLLRRVLSPTEFGSSQPVLAPVTEFAGGTTVQVDTRQLSGARIAGYRVWAFYP